MTSSVNATATYKPHWQKLICELPLNRDDRNTPTQFEGYPGFIEVLKECTERKNKTKTKKIHDIVEDAVKEALEKQALEIMTKIPLIGGAVANIKKFLQPVCV